MNALMHENSEAVVTGNETMELSIASMREKMDRDHAALAANQTALSERVHQNYSTLIEKINTVHHVLRDKIDAIDGKLGARIDLVNKELGNKIDAVDQKLGAKIDAVDQKLDTLSNAFAELRGLHKTVLWVCGGIVTIVTVGISVGKAVGWI